MIAEKIDVLDHGYVRLVDRMGDDLSVVRAARVSHDADWRAGWDAGSDHRLINYLWRNKHTSPFEAVQFTFEVMAPIFVLRQWHRHRTWSYNEVSARYTELPDAFYVPDAAVIGRQSDTNKQARALTDGPTFEDEISAAVIRAANGDAFDAYHKLLARGVPRELARVVLPVATYSRMFATVDLLNLFKFLTLRMHSSAQWEIQQYAKALLDLIRPHVPECVGAWKENK